MLQVIQLKISSQVANETLSKTKYKVYYIYSKVYKMHLVAHCIYTY